MVLAIILVLGYLIGGFMAMFIYRWPNEIKIFSIRKDQEGNIASWYEAIPILGYIITKGKNKDGSKKLLDEIVVPIINMLCYLALYLLYGEVIGNYLFMAFISVMIVVIYIDFRYMLIPDRVHIALLIIGVLGCIFNYIYYPDEYGEIFDISLLDHILGAVLGFLPIYLIGLIISKIKHTDAIGGGDIKLLGAAGLFAGWKAILLGIFTGALIALIVQKILQLMKKKEHNDPFAFGPFLAIGIIIMIMTSKFLISWYVNLLTM